MPPSAGRSDDASGYRQFVQNRYAEFGGIHAIEGMLIPEADTTGAVLNLYLLESGANVSVGRTLDRECLQASDLAGFVRITGHKARAGGKPIFAELAAENVAIRAIYMAQGRQRSVASRGRRR